MRPADNLQQLSAQDFRQVQINRDIPTLPHCQAQRKSEYRRYRHTVVIGILFKFVPLFKKFKLHKLPKHNVNYETIYENRFKVLKIAFEEFKKGDLSEFYDFLQKNETSSHSSQDLPSFSLFMLINNA